MLQNLHNSCNYYKADAVTYSQYTCRCTKDTYTSACFTGTHL